MRAGAKRKASPRGLAPGKIAPVHFHRIVIDGVFEADAQARF